jgi:hypothetical protein
MQKNVHILRVQKCDAATATFNKYWDFKTLIWHHVPAVSSLNMFSPKVELKR